MDRNEALKELTLRDLRYVFLQRLPWLILIPLLCTGILYGYAQLWLSPQYTSTVTMYILRQSGDELTITEAVNDYNLALKLVNDCTYLLKSHTVIDAVREELDLPYSYKDLCERITTNNPVDTRILEVTVRADTPELARDIINRIGAIGADSINSALGFQQVTVFEDGILSKVPSNSIGLLDYAMTAFISAMLVFFFFIIWYLADDTIHSPDDIERYLGLSILGEIPDANRSSGSRYGYGYGYRTSGRRRKPYTSRKEK